MPALPPERPGCPWTPGGRRPLPDPAAIQLFLVPESAPPYDEEVPGPEVGGGRLPARPPRDAEPPGRDSAGPPAWPPHGKEPQGRGRPPARPGRGEARPTATVPGAPPGWQNRFAQILAETLTGARPPRQIVPWTTEEALRRIQRLGPRLASDQRPRVRRVLTSLPAPDVMEMTVVVGFGPRVKALAVRLELTEARAVALPGRGPGERAAGERAPDVRAAGEQAAAHWVCTAVEAA